MMKIGEFNIAKSVGSGAFGAVLLAKHEELDHIFAVKVYNDAKIFDSQMQKQVLREIEVMQKLNHPYILRLYNHFYDDDYVYLVLEYALNGDLFSKLNQLRKFSESRAATVFIFFIALF